MSASQRDEVVTTSLQQERELLLSCGQTARENLFYSVQIEGAGAEEYAREALQQLVLRHEILRSRLARHDGRVVAILRAGGSFAIPVVDISRGRRRSRLLADAVLRELDVPFDLSRWPLLRPLMIRLAGNHHILVVVMPHTIADGFSRRVFFRDYGQTLVALVAGTDPCLEPQPVQPRHFAEWERTNEHGAALRYWESVLGDINVCELNPFTAGVERSSVFRHRRAWLGWVPRATSRRLDATARRAEAPVSAPLLASLAILSFAAHRGERALLSVQDANRWLPGARQALGCLYDVIPVVVPVHGKRSFTWLVRTVGAAIHEAKAHRVPWTVARGLLPGPCDLSLNYFRDLPQMPPFESGCGQTVRVSDYRPAHRRYSTFPSRGYWGDALTTVSAAVQLDGSMNLFADYHERCAAPALPTSRLRTFLGRVTRLAASDPSRTIEELAEAGLFRNPPGGDSTFSEER